MLFLFAFKVTGSLVQQGWVPKSSQTPGGVWTGIGPVLNVTTYSTGPISLVFNVYGQIGYSPLVFNVYSSFLGWFVLLFYFFCDFCHLVGWFSDGFTLQSVPGCLFSIHHKVKEWLAKMKVWVLSKSP